MRGATPLDVAAASVMDNNELALALREPDLEKVLHPPLLTYCIPKGVGVKMAVLFGTLILPTFLFGPL